MRRAPLAGALVLLLAGCGSTPGTIAFTSTRDGNAEVYVMRADGSHVVDLTRNLAQDGQPAWSPDGTRLAFVSTRDGNAHIYVMSADGSAQRQLTRGTANDTAPVWSPDGSKIAHMCTVARPVLVTQICVVGANGHGARTLPRPGAGDSLWPVWIVGLDRILFTHSHAGYSVYAVGPDGSDEHLFLTDPAGDAEPAFAPDGRLAYLRASPARARWALYVERRRVAVGQIDSPAWSPDGTRLAFVERSDLYVVNTDGSGRRRLTSGPGNSLSPRWSPDGKSIAFERLRSQSSEVYVVRADGTGEKQLTRGDGKNGGPVWRPAP